MSCHYILVDDDDDDDDDSHPVLSVWQAKARDAREQRRSQLTAAHRYIIEMAADALDLDYNTTEDFVIDDYKVT